MRKLLVAAFVALSSLAYAQNYSGSGNLVVGTSQISGGALGQFLAIGPGGLLQSSATSATIGFPQAATAATSGGVVCATSTTSLTTSALLPANALMIGGGAGFCPTGTTTGTGVLTALGIDVGTAGSFVTMGGALGTPSSANLANATGLPLAAVTGLGTGVGAALATNVGLAGAPVLFNGALGTPSSGTLTNATGLPIATGVSGLGTGAATALGTAVGSAGSFVVNGGALGTPLTGTLTNATGLPISTGVSGLGTGVAAALGVNVGSAGAVVTNGGALGTPSSGTLTNATGLPIATGVSGLGTGVAGALATNLGSAGAVVTNNAAASISGAFTMTSLAPQLVLGVNATTIGSVKMFGNTSGDLTLQPTAAAGTASVATFPGRSGTVGYTSGALTSGNAAKFDASGNIIDAGGVALLSGGALGTPSSGTLTNATGLPISTGVSGLGTGVATALGINVGSAGAAVVNGGALGTPSSGTLTNATGLPIATGVSGLGTNVATALGVALNANGGMAKVNGTPVASDCLQWNALGVTDSGSPCATGTDVYAIATCGLVGNGVTDESAAIQTCIDNHKGQRIVFDQNKTFLFAGVKLSGATYNGTALVFKGKALLKPSGGLTNYQGAWVGLIVENVDGVEIIGNFDGNSANQPATSAAEFVYSIGVAGATNLKIHDIDVRNIAGDGMYVGALNWTNTPTATNCSGLSIKNANFYNSSSSGRNAVSIASCINVNITGLTSTNVGGHIAGTIMPGGIDIEPNWGWERVQNVSMSGINITCGGSSCLAVQGQGIYFTVNTTSGSAALASASTTTNVNAGDNITCADGSGVPVGGATIYSIVSTTINLNPGETANATATGAHCNTAPTTKDVTISSASVVNNAPADTLDGNSAMTLAGARTLFIKDSSNVQVTGFNGTCGAAGVNCEPIVVKNGDRVSIKASGVRNCETCVALVSNTDVDGTTGGVTNSDIDVNCSEIARSCFRVWRTANTRIGGIAEHPRAGSSFYPGGVFAYWMDSNTLNNVTYNVRIPYSPNWNLGFQGGATLNNVRVVNSDFGSGWALGTLRASFNNAVNIPFINSNGFNDVAAAPTPGAACGSTAAFDAGANSTYGVLTPGGTGITTGCTITFATGSKPAATAAYCTVSGLASTSTTTAITITPAVVSGTAYTYQCIWR